MRAIRATESGRSFETAFPVSPSSGRQFWESDRERVLGKRNPQVAVSAIGAAKFLLQVRCGNVLLRPARPHCRHDPLSFSNTMATIRRAQFPTDSQAVLGIWREFIANSPVKLDYQNNEVEFATFVDKYAAPKGCVLLAESEGVIVGCVAMRQVTPTICEMKRMYVRQDARGKHLGRELAKQLFREARDAGYREMRLDVQEKSLPARKLYTDLGFVPAEPISFNPVEGASFLGLPL